MFSLRKTLFAAAMGAAAWAFSVVGASAAIVCSGPVCWHVAEVYDYPPDARVIVHPDDWSWQPSEDYVWREHPGRGYWRVDRWIDW